jgi:beta/gamma crystallin
MAHIILFEHDHFHGSHKHVFDNEPNLNAEEDSSFNDKTSSLVVVENNWITYDKAGFDSLTQFPPILGLGLYPWVEAVGIVNDHMSSLQPTDQNPTVAGAPLDNHIVVFEHAHFRGQHKHVFTAEPDLNAHDDFGVSSVAVLKGNWAFYGKPGLDPQSQYPPILGPGGYPFVGSVQIANDQVASLQPVVDRPTVQPPLFVDQGVFLFEHFLFRGAHKHVVAEEPNLNADEDNFFNDNVGSFVIRDRQWIFYPDWKFQGAYTSGYHIPGQYPNVEEVGIPSSGSAGISSLAPLV